jgi:hypothetical protein
MAFPGDPACSNECFASRIMPAGTDLQPRNIVVRAVFSSSINGAVTNGNDIQITRIDGAGLSNGEPCSRPQDCLSGVCQSGSCIGNYVEGTASVSGSTVRFTPAADCPPPYSDRKCFDENAQYQTRLINGQIQCGGETLDCSRGICTVTFRTGTLIDVEDPQLRALDGRLCENSSNIQVQVYDDTAVSVVEYFTDGTSIATRPGPFGAARTWETVTPALNWNSGLPIGTSVSIRAQAEDSDTNTNSISRNFAVIAQHCCSGAKDADEEGVDCGGDDCPPCGQGLPIIDWISPTRINDPATLEDDIPYGEPDTMVTIHGLVLLNLKMVLVMMTG